MNPCPSHGRRTALDCPSCERHRRHDALAQSISTWQPWHLMATLTFDLSKAVVPVPPGPQRHGGRLPWTPALEAGGWDQDQGPGAPGRRRGLSPDAALKRVRSWLRASELELRRPITAVVALEHHKSGDPHFHGLLAVSGGLVEGDEITRLHGPWFDRNGFIDLERPRSVYDCAGYASKYLVKELHRGQVLFWPERGPLRLRWQEHRRLLVGGPGS